jgi:Spy/CpxP family protein refolding chaperone
MRKLSLASLLLLAFAATVLLAQAPPPQPPDPAARAEHQVKRMTTMLSLNSQQQQQATAIFTNSAKAESSVHQQMRSAHDALKAAVKSNNTAAIDQAAATIGNLTAQSTSIRAKAEAAFYQVLNSEQQQKLDELRSEGPGGFGGPWHHGPGGPGGPGPQ